MKKKSSATNANRGFHITIGAAPTTDLDFSREIGMVKATLLYADSATLNSPKASMLGSVASIGLLSFRQRVEFMMQLMPVLQPETYFKDEELFKQVLPFVRKKHKTRKELSALNELKLMLDGSWIKLNEKIKEILLEFKGDGLIKAINAGNIQFTKTDGDVDELLNNFFSNITEAIEKGNTHLMLDRESANLVSAAVSAGKIKPIDRSIERCKQIQLAVDLFKRLPMFELATVNEIIDIKKELGPYLIRYRSCLAKFSKDIHSASWDEDFNHDVEDTLRTQIEPIILDIEEAVQSNKYLIELMNKIATQKICVSGSVLGLAIANLESLPGIYGAALGVTAAGVMTAVPAYREWKRKQRDIEKNSLFFYYEAKERLS